MSTRFIAIAVGLVLGAYAFVCSGAQRAPVRYTQADEQYVLLWDDTAFFRSQHDATPLRAYDFGAAGRRAHPGEALVARLLEDDGEWIQIATGPIEWLVNGRSHVHCLGNKPIEAPTAMTLWVHASDVAPVLRSAFARSYPDGSSVNLLPGVPIIDGHPWVEGFLLPITIPADQIGTRYHPTPDAIAVEDGHLLRVKSMKATLGGAEVAWKQTPWNFSKPPWVSFAQRGRRVRENRGCGTIELLFHGVAEDEPSPATLDIGSVVSNDDSIALAAGTPLTWLDGSPAGRLTERYRTHLKQHGAARCFETNLIPQYHDAPGDLHTKVTLCIGNQ
jgi:hypothetical protein